MTFKTIETQEELDAIISTHLNREREKLSTVQSRMTELEKQVKQLSQEKATLQQTLDTAKTSTAGLESQISELQTKVKGYETTQLKHRIAIQNGVPYEFAERLQGTTEEELMADAQNMAGLFKPTATPPLKDVEPQTQKEDPLGLRDMVKDLKF